MAAYRFVDEWFVPASPQWVYGILVPARVPRVVGRRVPHGRGRPRAGGAREARPAPDARPASVPPALGA